MTVTLTEPTEPAPVVLARDALAQVARVRDAHPSELAHLVGSLTTAVEQLLEFVGSVETVTEYGVRSLSKATGEHVVDPAKDIHDALSTWKWTRRKCDATACVVRRQVLIASMYGEWLQVDPDEARTEAGEAA